MKFITVLIISVYVILPEVIAQDSLKHKLEVSGYLSTLQSSFFSDIKSDWQTENTLHNRLQLSYRLTPDLTMDMHLRNRLVYGDMVKTSPNYISQFEKDKGIVDLNWNLSSGNSYLLNSQIDRAYIKYQFSKCVTTVGRQRINWGQTFVWNPMDIFNTYSFFDFDYPERPGSDAVRFEYFGGYASGFEVAAKTDSTGKFTSALLLKLNKWNYDFQLMGGVYETDDFVFGAGWSGNIKSVGVYGEISYIGNQYSSYFYTSVAFSYITPQSLSLQTEFLFAHNPHGYNYSSFSDVLNRPLTSKNLAFSKYSTVVQIGYPVNPLFNVNISWMWLPSLNAHYFGPNLSYSVGDNVEVSFAMQHFQAYFPDEENLKTSKHTFTIGFLRFKISF